MIGGHPAGPDDDSEQMRSVMGPQAADEEIRQAISTCWMMLPKGKENPDAAAEETRRIVERALANLKEDADAFSISGDLG